jgi:hypothetical protein
MLDVLEQVIFAGEAEWHPSKESKEDFKDADIEGLRASLEEATSWVERVNVRQCRKVTQQIVLRDNESFGSSGTAAGKDRVCSMRSTVRECEICTRSAA